jgi:hypothetical protein
MGTVNAPNICSIEPIAQAVGPGSRGRAGIAPIKLGQNGLPRVTLKSAAPPSCSDLPIWREAPVNSRHHGSDEQMFGAK